MPNNIQSAVETKFFKISVDGGMGDYWRQASQLQWPLERALSELDWHEVEPQREQARQ